MMGTSSFFTASAGARTCICSTLLPTFYFHSLLPRARVKLHTTIHKHKAARTYISAAIQNTGNSISGQKRGMKKINEDSKSEEADSVTHVGNDHMENISTDTEFILLDSEDNAENQDFLELDPQLKENDEENNNNNFAFKWPPLVCCFGSAQSNFTPITATNGYADLVRARGGPPCNVAIKLARLGCRVAFMGKVGNDASGRQMVIALNMNNVQTRGLQVDPSSSTSISYMKLNYRDSKVGTTCIKPCAEDSLLSSEINVDILREVGQNLFMQARIFYFNSMPLLTKSTQSTLFAAIKFSKKCGGDIFFDINLSLPHWRSRVQIQTRQIIEQAWKYSNVIKVSKQELDFLLHKDYFRKNRSIRGQNRKNKLLGCDPPTRKDLLSLWHDDLKVLLVNDGATLHYYTPLYAGSVPGIEDPCLTRFSYDRAASNDTFIAELMSKMVIEPGIHNNHRRLHTVIRFAITSAIVTQGLPSFTRPYATDSQEYKMETTV